MLSVKNLRDEYKKGVEPKAKLEELYSTIQKDNERPDKINGYNALTPGLANAGLQKKEGLLAGIFVAVKDNIHIKGEKTTCSSKILKDYTALYDATVVENLKNAGAIIVGKTNLDEFAMGATNTISYFGDVRNPHDRNRVAGGSSGGSVAVVAAGFTSLALGSDTGGSVRVPSAYCGVVGLKPTYGAISRYGVMAMAPILDQIGPIASNVEDCALLYSVLASVDEKDPNSIAMPKIDLEGLASFKGKKKIGIVKEFSGDAIHPEVKERFHKVCQALKDMGHTLVEVSLPNAQHAIETYFIISRVQGFSSLSMIDGVRYGDRVNHQGNLIDLYKDSRGEGFHPEIIKRIMMGNYILSKTDYYVKARKMQTLLLKEMQGAFREVDILLSPSCSNVAPSFDNKNLSSVEGFLVDMISSLSNITGTPAISIPIGKNSQNMPIGIQLMGNLQKEQDLFELGMHIQALGL